MTQKLHDSGKRRTFKTGAVRDRGDLKSRPDLISPHAQMREGMIMALGAEKYDVRNWEKGMPISECLASNQRHIEQYKRGDTDEDHLAQARWNLGAAIHFEEEIKAGRLPADLDDMPKYATLKPDVIVPGVKGHSHTIVEKNPNGSLVVIDSDHHRLSRLAPDEAPTFYIAGPMRGHEFYNFPLFDKVAKQAREKGYSVISPAELDREHGIDPLNDVGSVQRAEKADPNLVQTLAQRDCEVILNLKKDRGDGLILLPGWSKSTGARAEVALALWLGLKFRNSLHEFGKEASRRIEYVLFGQGEE